MTSGWSNFMASNEYVRIQRVLAIMSLGMVDALQDGSISGDEAERLLFSPGTMRWCEKIGASPELLDLIHAGTELEATKRLVSVDHWKKSLDTIRAQARAVLEQTDPSDPQLDKWVERMIKTARP